MSQAQPARVGQPIADVETPALLIDLEAYERNLDRMATRLRGTNVRLRAHAKTHKCPVIARHQVERGAVGVCCQKVSEASMLVAGGVRDVLVSNEIVGRTKIARLVALATQATIAVCVDDPANVAALESAAADAGVRLDVLVEIDVGAARCGVAPGEPALRLAQAVANAHHLRFAGIQAYNGRAQHVYDAGERAAIMQRTVDLTRETVRQIEAAGLACDTVTGGGTGTFDIEAASGVFNEIQAGSYVFMDVNYKRVRGPSAEFENALFVLTTVMSRPTPERAVCDAGLKAHSVDSGLPVVHGRADVEYAAASDEHGTLRLQEPERRPNLGDRLMLVPGHCDPTVNLYDWYVGFRGGRVETLWPITARGAVY